jgi:hypothetical protein
VSFTIRMSFSADFPHTRLTGFNRSNGCEFVSKKQVADYQMEDPLITMRISSAPATANMSHQSLLNKHVIIFSNFRLLRNYFFLLSDILQANVVAGDHEERNFYPSDNNFKRD